MKDAAPVQPVIVMIGTDPNGNGGVASVIRGYFEAGLGQRWPLLFLTSHREGRAGRKLAIWATAWLRLAWLVAWRRCGVLHLHSASRASFWRKWSFFLLARLGGVPVIWHIHGAEFKRFYAIECGRWRRRLIRRALGSAFCVVALSKQWRDLLQGLAPRANVVVIRNCVATDAVPGINRKPQTLLFLGRITQLKGVYDLMQAVRRLAATIPDIRLQIAGVGESEQVLACARELGVADRVELIGWITGSAKRTALAEASALVLPSYAEGLPMALLEAMAVGTPVIATPVGGVPDLVRDGHNGLLVAPGDVAALAAAIRRVLVEPGLAAGLGQAGQHTVLRDFGLENMLKDLGAIYRMAGITAYETTMVQGDHAPYTTV